jgi:hypothetical protein
MSQQSLQASDYVVWDAVRKHNSRARPYCTGGRRISFTHEPYNLMQVSKFKYCGYRAKAVGIGQVKPTKGQGPQIVLKTRNQRKKRYPRQNASETRIAIGKAKKVRKQLAANLNFRFYRGDLARIAARRVFKSLEKRVRHKRKNRIDKRLNPPQAKKPAAEEAKDDDNMEIVD